MKKRKSLKAKDNVSEATVSDGEAKEQTIDLGKLKKKELLEIMLRQGEEIDRLREQVTELEAKLEDKYIAIDKAGSIAEASLALTNVFEEAEKAVRIYLENIRRRVE
jgi:SMC interacting uncharacterized protein involved in chromosome segregation